MAVTSIYRLKQLIRCRSKPRFKRKKHLTSNNSKSRSLDQLLVKNTKMSN